MHRYPPCLLLAGRVAAEEVSCVGCSCHCTSHGPTVPQQHYHKVKCAAEHPPIYTLPQVLCNLQHANSMPAGKVSKVEQEAQAAEPLSLG